MEVFANELSINKITFEGYNNISNLRAVYQSLRENGITSCRIASRDLNEMICKLNQDPQKRNLLNFIYAFFHAPYEGGELMEENEDEYLNHQWMFENQECVGLAMSYLIDSLTISFDAGRWKEIVEIDKDFEKVSVRNVSTKSHVEYHQDWLDSLKEIQLETSDILWNDKKISLRDDHGKDKLLEFSKKLCKSPYVVSIKNSLPFNPTEKKFIHKATKDGIIECVLCWTDKGYGIVVQSTGRNLRETEKIAELLEKEYAE